MAGSYSFGGVAVTASYTDNYVYQGGIGLPSGRMAANGTYPARIYALGAYCRGRGAARTVVLSLGPAGTGGFTVASGSSATDTGNIGCSGLCYGGSGTFMIDMSGSAYFGRNNGSGAADSYGTSYGPLYGRAYYTEAPNQPTGMTATPSPTVPGQMDLTWVTPTDHGGDAITGYRIERSTDPTFATGVTAINVGVVNAYSDTGLTPGTLYYYRVAAKNAVTALAGTWSVYSGSISALARSGMKVWDGAAWAPASLRAWDGAAWQPAVIDVWDADSWEPAQ